MTNSISLIRALLAICLLFTLLPGCGAEKIDRQAKFDRQIEMEWHKNWNFVDAEQFFNKGGLFIDSDDEEAAPLDRPHILPLIKRLREKHGLKWQAVVHKKKTAFAVALVARLPSEKDVDSIAQTLDQEQSAFPGEILRFFGHQWMSLDFLTEEFLQWEREAEAKEKAA